jgi:hypothetical protein
LVTVTVKVSVSVTVVQLTGGVVVVVEEFRLHQLPTQLVGARVVEAEVVVL